MDPASGGTRAGAVLLCNQSIRMGIESEILCLDDPGESFLAHVDFPVHALGPTKATYRKSKHLVPWLKQNAAQYKVVIVHGLWQFSSFGTWLALKDSNTPYYVFTHGMLGPWFKKTYPLKHIKKWLYWPWAEYRVLRDATAVLFTCEQEKILARQSFWLYQANEVIAGFGAEAPPQNTDTDNLFLKNFPQLIGKRILLFVGRLHPVKGCDLLLDAFLACAELDESLCLVFAGPDQEGLQKKLETVAKNYGLHSRVIFTGMITGNQKWDAYRSAELFILPSHHENFGVTVAESLACGLPVLITDQVNIHDEISADGAGLVAEASADGITLKLNQWLMLNRAEREKFSKRAVECYQSRYTLDVMTTGFLNVVLNNYI